ncbi:hypothetical protein Ancab_010456 [Ancistrocladus abbreviatus]
MPGFWQSSQRTLRLLFRKQDFICTLPRSRCYSCGSGSSCSKKDNSSSVAVMSFGDGNQGALGLPSLLVGIGGDAYEPTKIPGLPPDICSISAGHYHSLAVTSQGKLWAWGRNDEGQLGRGLTAARESWSEPKRVEGLTNVTVQAAFSSGVISVAIGDDGSLWVWGKSKHGQLGHGKGITEAILPSRVEALAGEEISKLSLGWGHALAQTVDGKLYGWGYSADGRLGQLGDILESSPLDSVPDIGRTNQHSGNALDAAEKFVRDGIEKENNMPIIWEPRFLEELQSVEVIDIACGLDHSLVLCLVGVMYMVSWAELDEIWGFCLLICLFIWYWWQLGLGIPWLFARVLHQMLKRMLEKSSHGDGTIILSLEEQDQRTYHLWWKVWKR